MPVVKGSNSLRPSILGGQVKQKGNKTTVFNSAALSLTLPTFLLFNFYLNFSLHSDNHIYLNVHSFWIRVSLNKSHRFPLTGGNIMFCAWPSSLGRIGRNPCVTPWQESSILCVLVSKNSRHNWRNKMCNISQLNWTTEKRYRPTRTENYKWHKENYLQRGFHNT